MAERRFELSLQAYLRDHHWYVVKNGEGVSTRRDGSVDLTFHDRGLYGTRLYVVSPAFLNRSRVAYLYDSIQELESAGERFVHPPKGAEFLFYLFLPKTLREASLGDLNEDYQEVYLKFGLKLAAFWYYKQVFTSLWPLVFSTIRKGIKWAGIGLAGHWVKKVIGG